MFVKGKNDCIHSMRKGHRVVRWFNPKHSEFILFFFLHTFNVLVKVHQMFKYISKVIRQIFNRMSMVAAT